MHTVIENLRDEFRRVADEKFKEASQRYFKEAVEVYGIRSAQVTELSKRYYEEVKGLSKSEIFDLCEELWQSGIMEESFVACNWSYRQKKQYKPEDFSLFKGWVERYVTNWAACDTLCNHNIGDVIMKYPEFLNNLIEMTQSDNRWVKRASAVSLIIPAKRGLFKAEIFTIADRLLLDKDDMVQKGYGWMLKALSHNHLDEVFDFVMNRRSTMPRTALRYAIEKMPEEYKKEAMKKV